MARPRVKGSMITGWLAERRGTAREVAHGLQLSIPDATWHLHRLQQLGEVHVVGRVKVPHATRPVAVYGSAQAPRTAIFSDDWLRSS